MYIKLLDKIYLVVLETLNTIKDCKTEIEKDCKYENSALEDYKQCYETAQMFGDKVDACLRKNEKCSCLANIASNLGEEIKNCNTTEILKEDRATKAGKTKCKKS